MSLNHDHPIPTRVKRAPVQDDAVAWFNRQVQRGRREIFSTVVTLTPELAALLLTPEVNTANRVVRPFEVRKIARQIKRGDWKLNGAALVISNIGTMNDGQHRCLAVLQAGIPVMTNMSFGYSVESRRTIDAGVARKPGDLMTMQGVEKGADALGHALRLLYLYREFGGFPDNKDKKPDKMLLQHLFDKEPDIQYSIPIALGPQSIKISKGVLIFVHHVLAQLDRPAADRYIQDIKMGVEMAANDPVMAVRKRIFDDTGPSKSIKDPTMIEMLFHTWNNRRKRRKLKKYQKPNIFPTPI